MNMVGGLGNQLFQAAAGLALADRREAKLILQTRSYRQNDKKRQFMLQNFPLMGWDDVSTISRRPFAQSVMKFLRMKGRRGHYIEPHLQYDPDFLHLQTPIAISGYFQSEMYFKHVSGRIRAAFNYPLKPNRMSRYFNEEESFTALHVRRGDYIGIDLHFVQRGDYYKRALDIVPQNQPVVVVSDDIEWSHENLSEMHANMIFPGMEGPRDTLDDFRLLTKATNHIIANSSFSWWGAWLAEPKDGITIAPHKSRWFNAQDYNTDDLVPARWAQI